jgi:hypothetical protein
MALYKGDTWNVELRGGGGVGGGGRIEFFQPVFPFQLMDHSSSPRPIHTRKELMPTKKQLL